MSNFSETNTNPVCNWELIRYRLFLPIGGMGGGGGFVGLGELPNNRLMGMYRWMGSHFHDWVGL